MFRGPYDEIVPHSPGLSHTPPPCFLSPSQPLSPPPSPILSSLLGLFPLLENFFSQSHYFLSKCYSLFNNPVQTYLPQEAQAHVLTRKTLPSLYPQSLFCCFVVAAISNVLFYSSSLGPSHPNDYLTINTLFSVYYAYDLQISCDVQHHLSL